LIISQDSSAYGVDLGYRASRWRGREVRSRFLDPARELGSLGAWIRLHYVYPYPHVDDVIPLMAERKILPYLDIPFQHASPAVLRRMRRPAAQDATLARLQRWRDVCPDLTIRSSFIVGFPGETDADFELLLDWLDEAELDRVGCFRYEAVNGAEANALAPAVPEEVKEERWHRLIRRQQAISARPPQAQGWHPPASYRRRGCRGYRRGPEPGRCTGDRRRRVRHQPPSAPRR
jgi:ribosomal protein S12 methylthiotransferase